MRWIVAVWSCFASWMAASCGSGGSPTNVSAPGTVTSATGAYRASCEWRVRCGRTQEDCGRTAVVFTPATAARVREAYWVGVARCFASLACSMSEEACSSQYTLADPAYPNVPVVQRCLEKVAACAGAATDKDCHFLAALTDAARESADACRALPCAELRTCLQRASFGP